MARHNSAGLGVVLTSQGGQIYGFDINQSGSDGVLATAANVETFDENSGKITKSFPGGRGGVLEHTWKCPATGSYYHLWVWGRQLGTHGATQWSAAGWEGEVGHCIDQGPVDMSPIGEGAEES